MQCGLRLVRVQQFVSIQLCWWALSLKSVCQIENCVAMQHICFYTTGSEINGENRVIMVCT